MRGSFPGGDDFTPAEKTKAASDLSAALDVVWSTHRIAPRSSLNEVAQAHLAVVQAYLAKESIDAGGRITLNLCWQEP